MMYRYFQLWKHIIHFLFITLFQKGEHRQRTRKSKGSRKTDKEFRNQVFIFFVIFHRTSMKKSNTDQWSIFHIVSENEFWVKEDTTRERLSTRYPFPVSHMQKTPKWGLLERKSEIDLPACLCMVSALTKVSLIPEESWKFKFKWVFHTSNLEDPPLPPRSTKEGEEHGSQHPLFRLINIWLP